jgi:hypothetical protein
VVELHIDSCHIIEEKANKETKFGGWFSIRKSEEQKPLIMFGMMSASSNNYTQQTNDGKLQMERQS